MAEKKFNLRCLLSLLDDPDEGAVVFVLSELLAHENELDPDVIDEFYENGNDLARKRISQLQSALEQRCRRRDFLERVNDPEVDFFDLLVDLHLQWFDTDSEMSVRETMSNFFDCVRQNSFNCLEDISHWMIGSGLAAEKDSTIVPELYCVGNIFSTLRGAASLLSAIVFQLFPANSGISVGKVLDDFAVRDSSGNILIPVRNWQIFSGEELPLFTPWSDREIIKLASANLFSAAVNSDSLRYVLTIAQALTGWDTQEVMQALPYPYNGPEGENSFS